MLGLLEWPPLGPTHPLVIGSLVVGVVALVLLVVVERRAANPMIPRGIFKSRAFTLANVLTLFLYAALAEMFFLVPMDLIQVRRYSATLAGAAIAPVLDHHVRAVALVGRTRRARRQSDSADDRPAGRGGGVCAAGALDVARFVRDGRSAGGHRRADSAWRSPSRR